MIRRHSLLALAALGAMPAWAVRGRGPGAAPVGATLAAAWQAGAQQHIGLIDVAGAHWSVRHHLEVPTRAHGLWVEPGGSVLAAARRPGDWLLRWQPRDGTVQWHWIDDDRRFNGHVIASTDGATLWTTETDLDTTQGRLGVRNARSLEKTAEWATAGRDPHALLALPEAVAGLPAGTLIVANGGIPTLPETGRAKRDLGRMDASLVALDPADGQLLGQWRLDDPYLSIRHLAWDPVSRRVGVALQAEHPDATAKAAAPVLAVWDGRALRAAEQQPVVQGYGGDICARPGGGFVVSCPRADTLALFDAQGRWQALHPHRQAYALAAQPLGQRWWNGGERDVMTTTAPGQSSVATPTPNTAAGARLQLDNHWLAWARP